jgi:hypothetical protein
MFNILKYNTKLFESSQDGFLKQLFANMSCTVMIINLDDFIIC